MSASSGLVIAGSSSDVGKTSVTLGLVRPAPSRRRPRVRAFKVGFLLTVPTYSVG